MVARRDTTSLPRAVFLNVEKGLAVVAKESPHTAKPKPTLVVIKDAHDTGSREAVLLYELFKGGAIVTIRTESLTGEPNVSGLVFVNTPNFIAIDESVFGKIGKHLSVKPTNPFVRSSKPYVA